MGIGVFAGSGRPQPSLQGIVRQIVEAENEGFDSFWFPQVFGPDVLSLISLVGGATKRIEIGTAVVPTFLRHPLVMA